MKLWELRSYEQVIKLEQERLVYQARLRSRFGRAWRRKAPVESLMPLRLARYGVPLAETAPAGLAAAGIEPAVLPPAPAPQVEVTAVPTAPATPAAPQGEQRRELEANQPAPQPQQAQPQQYYEPEPEGSPWLHASHPQNVVYQGGYDPTYDPAYDPAYGPEEQYEQWYEEQDQDPYEQAGQPAGQQRFPQQRQPRRQEQYQQPYQEQYQERLEEEYEEPSPEETGSFPIPAGPGRTRELGEGGGTPEPPAPTEEDYYQVFRESIKTGNGAPTPRGFIDDVEATYGVTLEEAESKRMVNRFSNRLNAELTDEHIA
jgi:hypothetical protein